jgi:hypothetical protein
MVEPIEWRKDNHCGPSYESSLKLPAKCNAPITGDVN